MVEDKKGSMEERQNGRPEELKTGRTEEQKIGRREARKGGTRKNGRIEGEQKGGGNGMGAWAHMKGKGKWVERCYKVQIEIQSITEQYSGYFL